MKNRLLLIAVLVIGVSATLVLIPSCIEGVDTPYDTKHLVEFHNLTTEAETMGINGPDLALFVDYSTCIAQGKNSPFYQQMVSPLTAAAKEYWSIKGDTITKEDISGDRSRNNSVYSLLNNVNEVNYAALDKAIELMAERDGESVLLTDGELFVQTETRDNPNNPYMYHAFKKWLMKDHDIHILAEPYKELYRGQEYNKKRFYIIFTDDRIEGNIYDRVKNTVRLSNYPEVDHYHLSGNYPWSVPAGGNTYSETNSTLAADISPCGTYEIQNWPLDWETLQTVIMSEPCDSEGNPLPMGEKIIGGLKVNRNAFGCYRIKDIDVKVYNINAEYSDVYNRLESGEKVGPEQYDFYEIPCLITYDKKEYNDHGNIDLYFDIERFAPDTSSELNGDPCNFFKIVISVKDLDNILDQNIDMFNFDSISHPGRTNVSISQSLNQCVYDPEIQNMLRHKILYTIYVKSEKF